MIRRAPPDHGAPQPPGNDGGLLFSRRARPHGFTLLEMCMVLFIIALLVAFTMPAMHSAFVEQAVRRDAQQLALMVKTGMIRSAEQHRAYVLDLTDTTIALHPAGETGRDADEPSNPRAGDAADADIQPTSAVVDVTNRLDPPNQILVADPQKAHAWVLAPPTEWTFRPGELCPATRVRLQRGAAYVEMSFNALTGNVQDEASYVP